MTKKHPNQTRKLTNHVTIKQNQAVVEVAVIVVAVVAAVAVAHVDVVIQEAVAIVVVAIADAGKLYLHFERNCYQNVIIIIYIKIYIFL